MTICLPVGSYRRPSVRAYPEKALATPPQIGNTYAAFCRLLSAHPVGASPGRGPYHAPLHRHAHAASGHVLPAFLVGPLPGRGPNHAVSHRHADDASDRLLPAHLVCSSPERGTCHASLQRKSPNAFGRLPPVLQDGGASLSVGTTWPPLAMSYWRTQLVHLPKSDLATSLHIGTPTSTSHPVMSYRRTFLVHLRGGDLSPPPFIAIDHSAPGRLLPAPRC